MSVANSGHPVPDLTALLFNPASGSRITQSDMQRITYGFPEGVAASYRQVVVGGFDELETFIDVDFVRDDRDPDIAFFTSNSAPGDGFANYSFRSTDSDPDFEVLNSTIRYSPVNNNTPTASEYYTILHEIGHGLTLNHVFPTSLPEHLPNLPAQFQDNKYTVMHYQGNIDEGFINIVRSNENEFFYRHYQLLDVYALQVRYGANESTFAGDSVHDFDDLRGDGYLHVLWDASGTDTIDTRGTSFDQIVDLAEGGFSLVGSASNSYNFSIAYGARIEHARTGNGDDDVRGNALANKLDGGGGNDRLEGKGGDDELDGGGGRDVAAFAGRIGDYRITALGGGRLEVVDLDKADVDTGRDIVAGIETLEFIDARYDTASGQRTAAFGDLSYLPETAIPDLRVLGDRTFNRLFGSDKGELLDGRGDYDPEIFALGGDDVVIVRPHAFRTKVYGGDGEDTAIVDGRFTDFDLSRQGGTTWLLRDGGKSARLKGFERIEFADKIFDTASGNATTKTGESPPPPGGSADIRLAADRPEGGRFGNKFQGRNDDDGVITAQFDDTGKDLTLEITGFDIDFANEVEVSLNGRSLGFLSKGPDNGLNGGDSFEIAAADQRPGSNILTFEQTISDSYKWGVTDILLRTGTVAPPPSAGADITLRPNVTERGDFGNKFNGKSDPDGLVTASFQATGKDLTLEVTGFDIDFANEVEVSLNGRSLGFLSKGPNNGLNSGDSFEIAAGDQRPGSNILTFEQAISDSYKWGVTDIRLDSEGSPPPPPPPPTGSDLADLFPARELIGDRGDNNLGGSGADELLNAWGGNDTQHGQGGDDFLFIGVGRDKNYGGPGLDVAIFDGKIDDFSGVSGVRDAYKINDINPRDGDSGFDRVKAVEIFVFDDALFDTRTGQREMFADGADLVLRLEDLIASGDSIV